jgi:HK97 family phage portal protein
MKLWPFSKREAKGLTDGQLLDLFGAGGPTSAGVAVSSETALRVPAVAACIRTIAEAAASFRINVVEIGAGRVETVVPDHPVTSLLADEANGWTSGYELRRQLVVDALCRDAGGLAWVNWLNGQPAEIIRFPISRIAVQPDQQTGEPIYRIDGRIVPAQQIVHLRGPFERCPVTLCREAIGTALVMEQHAGKLFSNGARPGGIIESPKTFSESASTALLKGWREATEGVSNTGRTATLWDGSTFRPLTFSSVDAQFLQLRMFQLQEICRAFNIPAILVGDLTRATWSNSAEMQRLFLMLCLEPWLLAAESAFRRALFLPEERKRFAVRIERDDFSKVDLAVLATAINSLIASRVINPNEGRDWMGLSPRDGGEEYANPNTGASQPGQPVVPPKPAPRPDDDPEEDDDAA